MVQAEGAPTAPHPFVDGVLVGRHAWPYLRRGDGGVVVGVVVGLIQVPDGFFCKLPFQVVLRRWSRLGGRGQQGSPEDHETGQRPPPGPTPWGCQGWGLPGAQWNSLGQLLGSSGFFTHLPSCHRETSPKTPQDPVEAGAAQGPARCGEVSTVGGSSPGPRHLGVTSAQSHPADRGVWTHQNQVSALYHQESGIVRCLLLSICCVQCAVLNSSLI